MHGFFVLRGMTEQEVLKNQYTLNHEWTKRLVGELEEDLWRQSPSELKTTINWQLGHIILTLYYQALACTGSPREAVKEAVPIKLYIEQYTRGTDALATPEAKPGKDDLLKALDVVYQQVIQAIDQLDSAQLDEAVAVEHPLAKTKREVLSWCTHHQAWHNGQIALIKRMLTGKSF
jgi:hypothetical protein